jgi:hypothetical protein
MCIAISRQCLSGAQAENVHLVDRGLAVIGDLVEVDDRAVQVFAVDRRRERFVQRRAGCGLDRVGFMLVLADALADRLVAGFHEFDEVSRWLSRRAGTDR